MRGLLVLTFGTALSASYGAGAIAAVEQGAALPPTPRTISISDEGAKGFAIRHFPTRLRLYTYDGDRPGVSMCYAPCSGAWPPVRAPDGAEQIGDWTVVPRTDGSPQWAYRGKPVYVRYHDHPDTPVGDGMDGVWRIIPNIPKTPPAAR